MVQATKKSTRHHSRRQVRGPNGRFEKTRREQTAEERAETMKALYQWRDARRQYAEQLAAAKREERFVGVRSIAIFTLISAVMVGMLVAGTMGA